MGLRGVLINEGESEGRIDMGLVDEGIVTSYGSNFLFLCGWRWGVWVMVVVDFSAPV